MNPRALIDEPTRPDRPTHEPRSMNSPAPIDEPTRSDRPTHPLQSTNPGTGIQLYTHCIRPHHAPPSSGTGVAVGLDRERHTVLRRRLAAHAGPCPCRRTPPGGPTCTRGVAATVVGQLPWVRFPAPPPQRHGDRRMTGES